MRTSVGAKGWLPDNRVKNLCRRMVRLLSAIGMGKKQGEQQRGRLSIHDAGARREKSKGCFRCYCCYWRKRRTSARQSDLCEAKALANRETEQQILLHTLRHKLRVPPLSPVDCGERAPQTAPKRRREAPTICARRGKLRAQQLRAFVSRGRRRVHFSFHKRFVEEQMNSSPMSKLESILRCASKEEQSEMLARKLSCKQNRAFAFASAAVVSVADVAFVSASTRCDKPSQI